MNLNNFGWNEKWAEIFNSQTSNKDYTPARVSAVYSDRFEIITEQGKKEAKMSGKMIFESVYAAKNPAIGDWVAIEFNPSGPCIIKGVLPRESCLQRQGVFGDSEAQVIGTNVDKCLLVQSLLGDFNLSRLDRYVTMVWDSGAVPVIVLTKADLLSEEEVAEKVEQVREAFLGIDVFAISSLTNQGVDELLQQLESAKTYMVMGSSGVGKSTLLNALMGEEVMATADVREDDQMGRHTTTHRQMFMLKNGAIYIDTPGMREVGLFNYSGLDQTFSDISELTSSCKFVNCTHEDEPDCAIQEAIQSGVLSQERWSSYIKLKKEERIYESKQRRLRQKIEKTKIKKQKVHYKDFKRGGDKRVEGEY